MSEIITKGKAAKAASYLINGKTTLEKNEALAKIAEQLLLDKEVYHSRESKRLSNKVKRKVYQTLF